MPALSQNLTFTQNTSTTVAITYPNTATTALTINSNPIKGDGYYSNDNGLHTVQLTLTNFEGKIQIEASLATEPTNNDWFVSRLGTGTMSMDTTGLISETSINSVEYTTPTTDVKVYNLVGNYVWLRAKISNWTEGTVNSIKINY